jgi:DNA-binding CsgD family transcriptional regulator
MLVERDGNFRKVLSHNDALTLLELIERALTCADESSLRGIIDGLRSLVPFDYAICGTAHIKKAGAIDAADIVNISYPAEWLALYVARGYYKVDPVIKENFGSFTLQYWDDSFRRWEPPKDFLQGASDFGLVRGYSHGLKGPDNSHGSIFSFSGKAILRESRTEVILSHLVPHLHNAINRVSRAPEVIVMSSISPRERDVLKWVRSGKTNAEIGAIIGISENTVKYHLKAIMQKLDTGTRAQAVAVALAKGIIEME